MVPDTWVPTARPSLPMPIRYSGPPILSLGTEVCADFRRPRFCSCEGKMMPRGNYLTMGMVCVVNTMAIAPSYANHLLITEEEAKLPPPRGAIAVDRRGITRGPKIEVV